MTEKKLKRRISLWETVGGFIKYAILVIVSIFTAFPFIWMIISALKTKSEIMDISAFLPSVPQWSNFDSVIFASPIIG